MKPWNERVERFQLNPASATDLDIIRMAEEIVDLRKSLNLLAKSLRAFVAGIEEWENQK